MKTLFHRNERGATAVLVAGSLFLLMGVAAVSIDWGSATNQQRQDQTAADLGSIAAVQFATGTTKVAAINAGALAAMQVVEATIGLGTLDWTSCTPNPLTSNPALSPVNNSCISFTDNLRKARVIVPPVDVNAPFGNVIGLGTITTTAASVAGAESAIGGKVLPFGLPGASAGGTEICLRTVNNANGTGPCTNNQQGNFGTLDVTLFGDADFGTKKTCTGQTQNLLAVNMALGGDHPLGIHRDFDPDAPPGDIEDGATCNSNNSFLARPNIIEGQTGQGSALYPGMIEGSNSSQMLVNPPVPGRLVRGSNKLLVDSSSPQIDNTGLWNFIRSDKGDLDNVNLPPSCRASINSHAQMATCITDWRGGSGFHYLFQERAGSSPYIGDATRFAAVPELGGPSQQWGNGTQAYKISNIVPIYIEGTYWDCNNNGCQIAHFPGEIDTSSCSGWSETTCGVGSNGKEKLTALTGFILDKGMLPPSLSNSWPDTDTGIAIDLVG